ncbi:flagellar biosynthesis anti-sigma factor FlgM [uncultured Oceanicoccus sp.]|uniref:flagellar biosynthesis anti-sigma factor FlgM n=1 Tax=uncultured Oceanicoccus sp. TaxID=1706381 RepID=UPI0030D7C4D4
MVRDINDLGSQPSVRTATDQGAKKATESTASATSNPTIGNAEQGDSVQLSPEAKTLQSMTDKINSLPEVNLDRVEKIKAALENAEHQVDKLELADKILNLDALL